MAGTEFWRDLKPIANVFKPHALPDVYLGDAPTDDERYYVPLSETVGSRPLLIQPSQNRWCDILRSTGAGMVNRHYHPHQVFAYTISGKWGYLEHDWVATAGDFVYEAPGEAHTLVAYESDEPMLVHFNVTGPLIWLDEDGRAREHVRRVRLHRALQGALRRATASAPTTSRRCSASRPALRRSRGVAPWRASSSDGRPPSPPGR